MKILQRGFGVFWLCFLLSSCVTTKQSQDNLLAFPWQELPNTALAAIQTLPPNLANSQSLNPGFPDLYLFIDRTISRKLYAEIWSILPPILAKQNISGLEQLPADWIDQILIYRPAKDPDLQGMLLGHFPRHLIRALILNDKSWQVREIVVPHEPPVWIFDNPTSGMHLALIRDRAIALQSDGQSYRDPSDASSNFNQHAVRVLNLLATDPAAKSEVPIPQANGSFAWEIAQEGAHHRIFGLASLALPGTVPVSALRLKIEAGQPGYPPVLEVQASLLPREGNSPKSMRTSIKLALVGLAGIAGLDANFIKDIEFSEKDGQLLISGLQLSEKGTAKLLGELLSQALDIKSPTPREETSK